MKKLIASILLVSPLLLFAQIRQNQWLVGGSFAAQIEQDGDNGDVTNEDYRTRLNVGWFATNRFVFGIRGGYDFDQTHYPYFHYYYGFVDLEVTNKNLAIGPFTRFYILPQSHRFNFYAEAYYAYGLNKSKTKGFPSIPESKNETHNYNINIAPVFFINKHVAIELPIGYYLQKEGGRTYSKNTYLVGLGLQVHLGKGKSE